MSINDILIIALGIITAIIVAISIRSVMSAYRARHKEANFKLPDLNELNKAGNWETKSYTYLAKYKKPAEADSVIKIDPEKEPTDIIQEFEDMINKTKKKIQIKRLPNDFLSLEVETTYQDEDGNTVQETKQYSTFKKEDFDKDAIDFDEIINDLNEAMNKAVKVKEDVNKETKKKKVDSEVIETQESLVEDLIEQTLDDSSETFIKEADSIEATETSGEEAEE